MRRMSGEATHHVTVHGSPTKYVKLNVGGSLHYTTIGTLTKQDSMLRAMFSGRMEVLTDTEGMLYSKIQLYGLETTVILLFFIFGLTSTEKPSKLSIICMRVRSTLTIYAS